MKHIPDEHLYLPPFVQKLSSINQDYIDEMMQLIDLLKDENIRDETKDEIHVTINAYLEKIREFKMIVR